jgi:hypothetical protein
MPNRSWIDGSRAEVSLAAIVAFDALVVAAGTVLIAAVWPAPLTASDWGFVGFNGVASLVFLASAWPIVRHRPRHPIGWLMLGVSALSALQFAAHYYSLYAEGQPGPGFPVPWIGAWVEAWIWLPTMLGIGGIFLLFPTGRLPSPGWRWLAVLAGVSSGIATASLALIAWGTTAGASSGLPLPPETSPVVDALATASMVAFTACIPGSALSLVGRFRKATGVERLQLKWLALAGVAVGVALGILIGTSLPGNAPLTAIAILAVPVAIAVAIVRHGLFDIDRLIKRTLVYGVLSVMLAALYAGCVLAAQPLVATLTGGTELAVAAATLVAAALFQPLRRRVQRAVDRRFDRGAYDAQQLVSAFAGRLRDRVYLDDITAELTATATQALRPAGVSVWLRHRSTGR